MANILIVEDEGDIAELYRLFLQSEGHTVVGVYADPNEALGEAGRRAAPDLVILDERLGGRSGSAYLPDFRAAFRLNIDGKPMFSLVGIKSVIGDLAGNGQEQRCQNRSHQLPPA